MMPSTHTISSRVKPRSSTSLIFGGGFFERNVGGGSAAAFLTVGPVGHDVIRRMVAGRPIQIAVVPGIGGHGAALQIWSVPGGDARRLADQCREPFRWGRKPARVEIVQVECAREALHLNPCRLDFGFAEIVENARTYQAHDEADDRDHHQHLDQRKSVLAYNACARQPGAGDEQSTNSPERHHDEPTLYLI